MLKKYHVVAILLSSLSLSAHAIDSNTKEISPKAYKEQASKSTEEYSEKTGKHKETKPRTSEKFMPLEKVSTTIDASDPDTYDKSMKKLFAVLSPEDKNKMFKFIKKGMQLAGNSIKHKAEKGKLEKYEHEERLDLFLSLFDNKTPSQAIQAIEALQVKHEKSTKTKDKQTKCTKQTKSDCQPE